MIHELKTWPGNYEAVASGVKRHDIRKADRLFKVGDSVILREWNLETYERFIAERVTPGMPESQADQIKSEAVTAAYTKRSVLRKITYISVGGSWGLSDNICVLSLS